MDFIRKHKLIAATIIIQLIALPLIVFTVKQQQNTQSKAAASTTLYFSPQSTSASPIQAAPGQNMPMDVMVNPGSNLISFAKIEVNYDPSVFTPDASNPVTVNNTVFPTIVEGPTIVTPGKLLISVSVGNSSELIIQSISKILTVNMKVTGNSNTTKTITFGPTTELLSTSGQDNGGDNVLSSTTPATIKVTIPLTSTPTPLPPTNTPSPTVSPTQTPTPSPTKTPTPTPSPSPTKAPSPTAQPPSPTAEPTTATVLKFLGLKLHGLGKGGDNPNPNSVGNLSPRTTTRPLTVELYDAGGNLVNTSTGTMTYTGSTTGVFDGSVTLPSTLSTTIPYNVKIRTPYYKSGIIPGILTINKGQEHNLTPIALIAGDVNQDGSLSVADYDIIMECYSDFLPAKPTCTAAKSIAADINDDGKVNQKDYNLWLREMSVQSGD